MSEQSPDTPGTAVIGTRDLARVYATPAGDVLALHPITLAVAPGSIVAVTGRSGSGKTTLLNLLGALDRPTSGEVVVCGEHVDRLAPAAAARWRARTVGFVFQNPGLMSTMSAAENVELGLRIAGVPDRADRRRRTTAALEHVGLADRAGHRPAELSGGQRQRVAIARAIASEHPLILADEPTAGLDSATAEGIFRLLRGLARGGTTIVMATHDPLATDHVDRAVDLSAADLSGVIA